MGNRVKHIFRGIGLLIGVAGTPLLAQADFLVKNVALSKAVNQRNPQEIFLPPAYCEKDKNGQAAIPVVQTSQTSHVVFWTKIEATTIGTIRHSWHHKTDGTWTKISEVDIPIQPSPGYRMWSMKSLHPDLHTGEWMIVVAPLKEPDRILCIARFTVK
ncbi:MAG: DUF2914 domain-containing protein [Nitrospirales bacterium]|nr:DUF2914 domain-containing protein [Nitrospira sp.]MDR4459733.1 DUF2914 domain-containing protein [Nitrospirales bacterium]MDR4484216.1 DUF2914 domain-containing protein [Nitrospirales bacterium]